MARDWSLSQPLELRAPRRLLGEFHCCQVEGSPVLAHGASMEQCSICLEALDGGVVALAACGHRFHAACLAQMAGAVGTATTRRGSLTACPNCRTVSRVDPVMPVAAFSIGDRVLALWGHKWFPGVVDGVWPRCRSSTKKTTRRPQMRTRRNIGRRHYPSTTLSSRPPPQPLRLHATSGLSRRDASFHRCCRLRRLRDQSCAETPGTPKEKSPAR